MFVDSDLPVLSGDIFDESKFNLSGSLLIGGIKDSSKINKKFRMTKGLKGAMQRVSSNHSWMQSNYKIIVNLLLDIKKR